MRGQFKVDALPDPR